MSLAHGTVAPGYESVRDMFEKMLRDGVDTKAQVCIYVGEEKVVDLWGLAPEVEDDLYGPDSIVNMYSSTKVLTSIVVAKMVDRGLLR